MHTFTVQILADLKRIAICWVLKEKKRTMNKKTINISSKEIKREDQREKKGDKKKTYKQISAAKLQLKIYGAIIKSNISIWRSVITTTALAVRPIASPARYHLIAVQGVHTSTLAVCLVSCADSQVVIGHATHAVCSRAAIRYYSFVGITALLARASSVGAIRLDFTIWSYVRKGFSVSKIMDAKA